MSVFTNPASSSPEQAREYVAAVLDLVGAQDPLQVLERTPSELRRMVSGLSDAQTSEPEAAGKWSIKQVLQHLADSELVWGNRLRMVLAHDRPRLDGYDQDLWAERLRYSAVDAMQAFEDFTALRDMNLRQLGRVPPEDLQRFGFHAERGEESVEHMLRLYAGHDLLHRRQLERIRKQIGLTPP